MSETRLTVDQLRRDVTPPEESRVGDRRSFMAAAALVGITVTATAPATAMPSKSGSGKAGNIYGENDRSSLDRLAVAELVQRERSARDQGMWDEMAACYHPESRIETAWFKGTGAEFVARTSRMLGDGKIVSLHQLSPSVVKISSDRALADTGCQLLGFQDFEGVPVVRMGQVRLLWRAKKSGAAWLIMGLNVIYVRDLLLPCNPNHVPKIDDAEIAKYRVSYRYESLVFAHAGRPVHDDLPGIDRPETVSAVRAADEAWLEGAS